MTDSETPAGGHPAASSPATLSTVPWAEIGALLAALLAYATAHGGLFFAGYAPAIQTGILVGLVVSLAASTPARAALIAAVAGVVGPILEMPLLEKSYTGSAFAAGSLAVTIAAVAGVGALVAFGVGWAVDRKMLRAGAVVALGAVLLIGNLWLTTSMLDARSAGRRWDDALGIPDQAPDAGHETVRPGVLRRRRNLHEGRRAVLLRRGQPRLQRECRVGIRPAEPVRGPRAPAVLPVDAVSRSARCGVGDGGTGFGCRCPRARRPPRSRASHGSASGHRGRRVVPPVLHDAALRARVRAVGRGARGRLRGPVRACDRCGRRAAAWVHARVRGDRGGRGRLARDSCCSCRQRASPPRCSLLAENVVSTSQCGSGRSFSPWGRGRIHAQAALSVITPRSGLEKWAFRGTLETLVMAITHGSQQLTLQGWIMVSLAVLGVIGAALQFDRQYRAVRPRGARLAHRVLPVRVERGRRHVQRSEGELLGFDREPAAAGVRTGCFAARAGDASRRGRRKMLRRGDDSRGGGRRASPGDKVQGERFGRRSR